MSTPDSSTPLGVIVKAPAGRALVEQYLPGLLDSPMGAQVLGLPVGFLLGQVPAMREDPAIGQAFLAALADLDPAFFADRHAPALAPDPAYEDADVPRASAEVTLPGPTPQWGVVEVTIHGPAHANPFVDVELTAEFQHAEGQTVRTVGGFYDGDGVYRLRLMAEEVGTWTFETTSTARSLDALVGQVEVTAADGASHGPVRVEGFHFRHADGTRHRPWGTTAYAWNHQPVELQEATLRALAASPFTKIRMCLFPKSYLYNMNEPERYPFVRTGEKVQGADGGSAADGATGFDPTRFDTEYFANLETRIRQLAALGIEADLILFHPYDRWGFADLGPAVDERVVRYVTRRLAAFSNVWWSLANEYDLMAKKVEDWERIAEVLGQENPHGHLTSIHNCIAFYDYARPWITHCSMQRTDVYRTAENTDAWREQWGKPVVIDECAYEGDIDQGWGNITGEEMTRRFWEGAVRGGYVGHGETYLNDREELWWSKGGELVGSSPERIAFLERIVAASPTGVLDPLPSEWDLPWGGVAGKYHVGYFGFMRPRFRQVVLPEGRFRIDVLDTWNMTVEPVPGVHTGSVRVDLPARQFMALRLTSVD